MNSQLAPRGYNSRTIIDTPDFQLNVLTRKTWIRRNRWVWWGLIIFALLYLFADVKVYDANMNLVFEHTPIFK
jgi:hypothetical protein